MSPLRMIAAALALLALCLPALAQTPPLEEREMDHCGVFADLGLSDLTPFSIAEVQLGLLHAFQDANPGARLSDGLLGAYTKQRLRDLCLGVPRPEGLDPLRSTLQMTQEFAQLQQARPNWPEFLYALDLARPETLPFAALRLAATPAMASVALGRIVQTYDCADPAAALAQQLQAARAFATLQRLFPGRSDQDLCEMLPVAGGVDAWQQAMQRLGEIGDARIGALDVLASDGFSQWVAQGSTAPEAGAQNRLRRLVGTAPNVLALIDEYTTANPHRGVTGGPCAPQRVEATLTFYALEPADMGQLDFLLSLTPKLEQFRADQGGFDNPQALWRALRPVLSEDLDDCILTEIETLVTGPENLPLSFLIRPSAAEALMAEKDLETALPVITELAALRMGSREAFINRIRGSVQDVQDAAVKAEVTAAADTLAAASEPVPPQTDSALLDIEEIEESPDPTPLITVTDATDAAVETAIDNAALADKLRETPMIDSTVPELMRSQVRAALQETAAAQAQATVERQIDLIAPAVTSEWALTEALQQRILALPYVQGAISDATADGAVARLSPLVGVSYPSLRLFEDALRTVSLEPGKVPFSDFVTERVVQRAERVIDNPEEPRVFGPLQVEDCRCVPARQGEDGPLRVYGFYPFWLAPTLADAEATAAIAAGTREASDPAPQTQQLVNFETVDRIAFYGLEFRKDETGRVRLANRAQWQDARRVFVNSAHQHRAQADIAFDLRDWMTWDSGDVEDAVNDIAAEMAPFPRFEGFEPRQIKRDLPTLFDHPQPDGVTLIFHDYQGFDLGEAEMATLVRIIKSVYEALPNRDRLSVNVAFDFPLVREVETDSGTVFRPILDEPVFDALFELVQKRPYVLASEDASAPGFDPAALGREERRIIDRILLFLERPTTDAKKGLRFRMEQGLFQGEARRVALRSIIPVLPPAGHREVRTSIRPNDPDQTPRAEFSQLEDDVVYFKDNFGGIGFWPVPVPVSDPAAAQSPELAAETVRIDALIATHFNTAAVLPPLLAGFAAPIDRVCTYACPHRARVALAAIALFVAVLLLTWRSFYSGVVDQIAFRFMTIGTVWIGNIVLLGTLFVLAGCDPHSVWPDRLMWLLAAALLLLSGYHALQRIKNGPMP